MTSTADDLLAKASAPYDRETARLRILYLRLMGLTQEQAEAQTPQFKELLCDNSQPSEPSGS